MIKVNLLRDQSFRIRRTVVEPTVSRTGLLLAVVLVLLVTGLGSWWFIVHRDIDRLTASRDQLLVEFDRLQGLKREIDEFKNRTQIVQSKIDVVEKLRASQTGPVSLLNHLILSIPTNGTMWLTTLDQKGERIQIIGQAQRPELVPDFMSNLSRTGFFQAVDLELLEQEQDSAKFSIVCITGSRPAAD